MTLGFRFAGRTHPGRVRARNEDNLITETFLVAVADGLGGHAAGDVASDLARRSLAPLGRRADASVQDVLSAIGSANAAICRHPAEHPETVGLGTTVSGVALVVVDGHQRCLVFNIGDSRVYSGNGVTGLTRLTVDHSEVQELQDAGLLTPLGALDYPRRNVVTRCLGSEPAPVADTWVLEAALGERLLICTDGLTNDVPEDDIARLLTAGPEVEQVAGALIDEALAAGGRDNITVVVADVIDMTPPG